MTNNPLKGENPFEYVARVAVYEDSFFLLKVLASHFALNALEAKSVVVSCPQYQEKFCRLRIKESQKRGGSEYGNKVFLKKRFRLEGAELDQIFEEFWFSDEDVVAKKFLDCMSPLRIAKAHLTVSAQQALEKLSTDYGLN